MGLRFPIDGMAGEGAMHALALREIAPLCQLMPSVNAHARTATTEPLAKTQA
ncbi:hypothetical protein WBP06_04030 [Novosphingobium sp. BL-8H]|uniref:hypothetical protein n=1 Tax=Novosphingobium sp. BL-8H TaxID=3127640 RepID=UPI0037563435